MDNEDFRESLKVKATPLVPDTLTEREKLVSYNKFTIDQQEPFILFINYLNKAVNELRAQEKVSDILQIRARIKSPISAFENDTRGKTLNDIFGIEFICASEEEIALVKERMENLAKNVIDEKPVNKDNGYEAIHCLYSLKDESINKLNRLSKKRYNKNLFPIVEVHYETAAVYYEANFGNARHDEYKNTDMDQIRRLYEAGQLSIGTNLPIMWVSDPDNDNMRELSTEEVIKKLYPSLKLDKDEKTK